MPKQSGWSTFWKVLLAAFLLLTFAIALSALILWLVNSAQPSVTGQMLTTLTTYNQTLVAGAGFTKMVGFDTADNLRNVVFLPDNRLVYTGGSAATLTVALTLSFSTLPASTISFAIAINGAVDDGATPITGYSGFFAGFGSTMNLQFLYKAQPNDYFEAWVAAAGVNTTLIINTFSTTLTLTN